MRVQWNREKKDRENNNVTFSQRLSIVIANLFLAITYVITYIRKIQYYMCTFTIYRVICEFLVIVAKYAGN